MVQHPGRLPWRSAPLPTLHSSTPSPSTPSPSMQHVPRRRKMWPTRPPRWLACWARCACGAASVKTTMMASSCEGGGQLCRRRPAVRAESSCANGGQL